MASPGAVQAAAAAPEVQEVHSHTTIAGMLAEAIDIDLPVGVSMRGRSWHRCSMPTSRSQVGAVRVCRTAVACIGNTSSAFVLLGDAGTHGGQSLSGSVYQLLAA